MLETVWFHVGGREGGREVACQDVLRLKWKYPWLEAGTELSKGMIIIPPVYRPRHRGSPPWPSALARMVVSMIFPVGRTSRSSQAGYSFDEKSLLLYSRSRDN